MKEQLLFSPAKTVSILARMVGITDLIFLQVYLYYSSIIKKVISRNGYAKKKVEETVCKVLGKISGELDFKSENESDVMVVVLTSLLEEIFMSSLARIHYVQTR